jgi:hypothetical protein
MQTTAAPAGLCCLQQPVPEQFGLAEAATHKENAQPCMALLYSAVHNVPAVLLQSLPYAAP